MNFDPAYSAVPEFGVALVGGNLSSVGKCAARLYDIGSVAVASGDSQSLYQDTYVRLTLAAVAAPRLRVGPWVTNPVTRHPAVTASAIASLEELSPGRAFLGLGTGDSALSNLGIQAARLDALENYVNEVRGYWSGRRRDDGTSGLQWFSGSIPVGLGASGRQSLRLAGRIADDVWVLTGGFDGEQRRSVVAELERDLGNRSRVLESYPRLWWGCVISLGRDENEALEASAPDVATFANAAFRFSLSGKGVPSKWASRMETFLTNYDPRYHVTPGENPNSRLLRELGLLRPLAERVAIFGTADDCRRRLNELLRDGVDRIWLWTRSANQEAFLAQLGQVVAPPRSSMEPPS